MTLYLFYLSTRLTIDTSRQLLELATVASVGTLSSLFVDWPYDFTLEPLLALCSSSSKGVKIYYALALRELGRSRVAIVIASVSMASIHGPCFPLTRWRLAGASPNGISQLILSSAFISSRFIR